MEYIMPLLSFIACVSAYMLGASHGMRVQRGVVPNPIADVKKHIEQKKVEAKQEEIEQEMQSIMSVSYESMLEAYKRERGN